MAADLPKSDIQCIRKSQFADDVSARQNRNLKQPRRPKIIRKDPVGPFKISWL